MTATLLEVTDQLAVGIVEASGTSMADMGGRIALLFAGLHAVGGTTPGVGVIVTLFVGGLAVSAATLVWVSLLVRKALLLVAIVLAPVALSGLVWSATRDRFRRWASMVIALIVSKLVIVVVLLVATAPGGRPDRGGPGVAPNRNVPLSGGLVRAFRTRRAQQLQEWMVFGPGWSNRHDLVFTRADASP